MGSKEILKTIFNLVMYSNGIINNPRRYSKHLMGEAHLEKSTLYFFSPSISGESRNKERQDILQSLITWHDYDPSLR